ELTTVSITSKLPAAGYVTVGDSLVEVEGEPPGNDHNIVSSSFEVFVKVTCSPSLIDVVLCEKEAEGAGTGSESSSDEHA
ncbi:MAG: hypothetical protein RIB63_00960, partial [Fulvivirga sp.]